MIIKGKESADSLASKATVVDLSARNHVFLNAVRYTGWNEFLCSELDSTSVARLLELGVKQGVVKNGS